MLGLRAVPLRLNFTDVGNDRLISWNRLPYPCFYKVERLSKTTGLVEGEPAYHSFGSEYTFSASYEVPFSPIPMYYRITAYGMFGALTNPTAPQEDPAYREPVAPIPISKYPENAPASPMPFLTWHSVPGAVCYELEILPARPMIEGGILPDPKHLFSTMQIFTNGYQVDLRPFIALRRVYWRVRGLGLHHEPIGVFSSAEPIDISASVPMPDRPLINDFDQMPHVTEPTYPVYQWIPMHNATRYEVELMTEPLQEAERNNTLPAKERLWSKIVDGSYTCYDDNARPTPGAYYWRVRALDKNGRTIGTYSDIKEFIVPERGARVFAAALGDSITHGGGAVSFSPLNLEYSFITYLDFPTANLGRSGDTSHMSAERFDKDVMPYHPYNLLVLAGANSIRDGNITADTIIADLENIRARCERNDIRPIFLTVIPINPAHIQFAFHAQTDPYWREKLRKVNDYIKRQKYSIDLEPYFYDPTHSFLAPEFSVDGLHPDIRGKMLMAEIVNMHQDELRH